MAENIQLLTVDPKVMDKFIEDKEPYSEDCLPKQRGECPMVGENGPMYCEKCEIANRTVAKFVEIGTAQERRLQEGGIGPSKYMDRRGGGVIEEVMGMRQSWRIEIREGMVTMRHIMLYWIWMKNFKQFQVMW